MGSQFIKFTIAIVLGSTLVVAQSDQPKVAESAKPVAMPDKGSAKVAAKPTVSSEFVIGVDDVLAINVWKEPDLSRALQVRPDGKITLPLLGELQAAGKTAQALKEEIASGLNSYISHPEVTVIVQEVHSQKFNIMGQVSHSGTFVLTKPMTVLDGLAMGGGFNTFAKLGNIYVLRVQPDGARVRIPFNYKKVIKGQNAEQNVELETRDTIVVP